MFSRLHIPRRRPSGTFSSPVVPLEIQLLPCFFGSLNEPPVIDAIVDQQVETGQLVELAATAADDKTPSDSLTFEVSRINGDFEPGENRPTNSANGVFSWTPTSTGYYIFAITVRDDDGFGIRTKNVSFSVVDADGPRGQFGEDPDAVVCTVR